MSDNTVLNGSQGTALELLEALEELYDSVDSAVELTPSVMEKARAAISKAKDVIKMDDIKLNI